MRHFVTLLSGIILVNLCAAQRMVESSLGLDSGVFSALSDYGSEDYQGTPFLYDTWYPVIVTTVSGQEIVSDQSKLDIWQHKLIVQKNDKYIAVNNYQIASIEFSQPDGSRDTFMKVGVQNELRFAQMLKTGKIKLFKIPQKTFKKASNREDASSYNKKEVSSFSSTKEKYFISVNDEELVELKTGKKGFIKTFAQEYQSQISQLLKSQKPNLKDQQSLVAFLSDIEEVL